MTRFTEYTEAARAGAVELDWRHELIDPVGQVLLSDDRTSTTLQWGATSQPLQVRRDRISARSTTLRVPADRLELIPINQSSALHPDSGNRVRTSMGYRGVDGVYRWHLQSTSFIDRARASWSGATALELITIDSVEPIRSQMSNPVVFEAGADIGAVVRQVLAEILAETDYEVPDTMCTVPGGTFQTGTDRSTAINELLESCGWELTATPEGLIITQPIPTSADVSGAERWAYGDGGIPVDAAVREWQRRTPEAWQVVGGSLRSADGIQIDVLVFDTDPSSEGFARPGTKGRTIGTSRLPFVTSTTQAATAAYAQLRRNGTGPGLITMQSIPNPALELGDLVELNLPDLRAVGTYRVLEYTMPIEVDGLMSVLLRGAYDPALNYDPPLDVREGCVLSVTDAFDRPNQNLEDDEREAGSTDWTEVSYSWGVVGQEAIQRGNNNWCMAFRATPLCSIDHYVELEMAAIPSGRRVGPCVRNAADFSGYVALADSSRRVSLEMWQNERSVATLGEYRHNTSLSTSTIRLTAQGSRLTVSVNGTTVITANDTRRVGAHPGMLGYGGRQGNNAPRVASFSAVGI